MTISPSRLLAVATGLAACLAAHDARATTVYRIQQIQIGWFETPHQTMVIIPYGINAAGVVVGVQGPLVSGGIGGTGIQGFSWSGATKFQGLKLYAINDAGFVCGESGVMAGVSGPSALGGAVVENLLAPGAPPRVAYSSGGGIASAPFGGTLPSRTSPTYSTGASVTAAYAVNASNQYVGQQSVLVTIPGSNSAQTTHAYLASPTTVTDLGALPTGYNSSAKALNASGVVVGWSEHGGLNGRLHHAFRWQSGAPMADLGTLGGTESEAVAVNDAGVIAGFAQTATQTKHACVWQGTAAPRDLGTLGGAESRAVGMFGNRVVGTAMTTSGAAHAFVYDLTTNAMVDVNTLLPANSGWVLTEARAINASGTIVGLGSLNGADAAWVLIALNVNGTMAPPAVAPKPIVR